MIVWIAIAALVGVCVIGFYREPRRLRIGVFFLSALALVGLAILGTVLNRLDDPYNETAAWLLLGLVGVGLVSLIILALFLIYNGFVMMRKESRSTANMLSLFLGIALLVYIGIGFLALARNDALLAIVLLLTIPPVAYIGFVFTAFILYAWIYGRFAHLTAGPINAVIVLGAGLIGDRVTPLLAERLRKGKEVYERARSRNAGATIVVSGGQGPDEAVPEAVAMSGWLIEQGVPRNDVVQEARSRTTGQNLAYSSQLLRQQGATGPVAVVTSDYHAFRAATKMRVTGLDGFSVGATTARYFWPSAMIREFVALLRDHARLNIAMLAVFLTPLTLFAIFTLARALV